MKIRQLLILSIGVLALSSGCADGYGSKEEYTGWYQNSEDTENPSDAGDCRNGCAKSADPANDTYRSSFKGNLSANINETWKGYYGQIDKMCHSRSDNLYGGDCDVIRINAEIGRQLNVRVQTIGGGKMKPVLTLYGPSGNSTLYNGNLKSEPSSEITFLMPEEEVYLYIEEAQNYTQDLVRDSTCESFSLHGGSDYTYIVNVNNLDPEINLITTLDLKGTDKAEKKAHKLRFPGGAEYFRVKTDIQTESIGISINAGNHNAVFAALNHSGDEYTWMKTGTEGLSGSTKGTIDKAAARRDTDTLEYWFAVFDYNGDSGYNFDVTVSAR